MSAHRSRRTIAAIATVLALATVGVSACAGDSGHEGLKIVASTNVWGSVAQAVAGDDVEVTSIIRDPSADPHSYESSPSDAAAVIDADLVVYNGGGYDEFIEKILDGVGDKPTVDAFALHTGGNDDHGHATHGHSAVNEHVWYDMTTVRAVADRIAAELGALDAVHAGAYRDRAQAFDRRLDDVRAITDKIAAEHPHAPVAQTEPIAYYLLTAANALDVTPGAFQDAVAEGTDPPPSAVAATRDLLSGMRVRALVRNSQTQDRLTNEMRSVAVSAGLPVVEVSETLPEGFDFVTWQARTAQSLAAAIGSRP